jgi:PKD repeat protein
VLAGHSHSYERSYLLDGHYDTSGTLTGAMKKNAGDGRLDGQGAYGKPTADQAPHEGAVYIVAGSSGSTAGGLLNHPAMYLSLNSLGSLAIDLNGHQLDATFLNSTGTVLDTFTLLKGPASPPDAGLRATPASGTAPLTVQFADRSTGGPTSWTWDIDDDGDVDSQARNPRQTYTLPGLFSVRLSVANAQGTDTAIATNLICVKSANGLADADGDGTSDGADRCPCVFDPGQQDTDQDGAGDACDPDDDGDGLLDELDCAPLDPVNNTPPGDVGSSLVLGPENDAIAWTPVLMATTYNVYRGSLAPGGPFTYDHACLEVQSPDPASADPESPAEGWGFYYLVNARNACGEGPLGSDSAGGPIPTAACP